MLSNKIVMYQDDMGGPRSYGRRIWYPESLRMISPFLTELNRIDSIDSFSANIRLYLDFIMGRFWAFHSTHQAALKVHRLYRTAGCQYCVYLRSFRWAGTVISTDVEGEEIVQQSGFTVLDQDFQGLLKETLPPDISTISFINIFQHYPSGNEKDGGDLERLTIPSLRLLNHNWKTVVHEVISGASLVVLNAMGPSEGVLYEMELIRECGMEDRTIVTGEGLQEKEVAKIVTAHSVIDVDRVGLTRSDYQTRKLTTAIRSLSGDGFKQTNQVADLSDLPCWVVDRNISTAISKFSAGDLAGVPYENYIPSWLENNWQLLTDLFPKVLKLWEAIEDGNAGRANGRQFAEVLDTAVHVFYLAVTLERYYEMATSLWIMGIAHQALTGQFEIMATCYERAAQCAEWHGDSELYEFLAKSHADITREMASRAHNAD